MSEEAPTEPPPCDPWAPARRWWQPPLLDRLQSRPWPPLFVPFISGPVQRPSQVGEEQHTWRVDLDVAHFSPSEISVSVRRGFLEVEGKHAERPDEHGSTARWFTRKYRLPAEAGLTKMAATLSVDGILTVEGPVPESCLPAAVIIPIKVETEACEEEENKDEEITETNGDSSGASKAQRIVGRPQPEDYRTDFQLEARGDKTPPGSSTAEEEEEETHQEPAGESHPSPETWRDSAERRDATQSQESQEPEAADGEIQVPAAEPELDEGQARGVQSQEPEVPDTKQEEE